MVLPSQSTSNFYTMMKKIENRMNEYDDKLKQIVPTSTEMQSDVCTLSKDFSEFKTFVWSTLSLMKSQIDMITLNLDRHEAYIRRKVLLVHGFPEESAENLSAVILNTFKNRMGVSNISQNDIVACHRLGVKKDKPRAILVRFHDYQHRHMIWTSKTTLKGSGFTISEFLTVTRHHIFMEARKHFGMTNCWTADSKVIVILPDKNRRKLELMSDLEKLIEQFPQQINPANIPKSDGNVPAKSPRRLRRRQ